MKTRYIRSAGPRILCWLCLVVFSACVAAADDIIAEELEEPKLDTTERKWLSFSAYADIETAYICRGFVWDTRPYSAQSASAALDLEAFGIPEVTVWSQSAMSSKGTSAHMSHYAYAEIDYLIRYYYDIELAEGWRLRSGVGRQWVTNPGYHGGRTLTDWQVLQVLGNPYLTPYWRLRVITRPIKELFWCVGVKKSFQVTDALTLTVDLSADLGDNRHFVNLYGPRDGVDGARYHAGLKDFNFVLRADYAIVDHVSLFAFVGEFFIVHSEAREAVKSLEGPEMRRDLTYGGVGISVDF